MQHAASGRDAYGDAHVQRVVRCFMQDVGECLEGGGRRIRGRYGKGDEICWGRCVCKCIKPEEKK